MQPKKIAALVVLAAIIALAVFFGIRRLNIGGPKPPEWSLGQSLTLIDTKTEDLVTVTLGQLGKLGKKNGLYKNPRSGAFTLCTPLVCAACGEMLVPPPEMIIDDDTASQADRERAMQTRLTYICPKCGKPVSDYSTARSGMPGRKEK